MRRSPSFGDRVGLNDLRVIPAVHSPGNQGLLQRTMLASELMYDENRTDQEHRPKITLWDRAYHGGAIANRWRLPGIPPVLSEPAGLLI
jgi:hypothetical protein